MTLILFSRKPKTLVLQGFWNIEKERKLQYQWYHNFRSYLVEATGVEPVSENRFTQLSPGAVRRLKFPGGASPDKAPRRVSL